MSTKQTTARALLDTGRKAGTEKRAFDKVDTVTVATTDIDAADVISTRIRVKTSAEIRDVFLINEDLDSNGSPALVVDIGFYAANAFTSVTSGTATANAAGAVLDADALVDGTTTLQAATTKWTQQTPKASTAGVTKVGKSVWEILGYDADPGVEVEVAITVDVAAGTAAAGTLGLRVVGVE